MRPDPAFESPLDSPDISSVEAVNHPLFLIAFAAIGGLMSLSILQVLGALSDFSIRRHNLLVESKRMRLAYIQAIRERDGLDAPEIEVIDDEGPAGADAGPDVAGSVGSVEPPSQAGPAELLRSAA